MTESLFCDEIEFPHRSLEGGSRRCVQSPLVNGPGGFTSGPGLAGFVVADDARGGAERLYPGIETSPLGAEAIDLALLQSEVARELHFGRCPTLELVWRRHRYRKERIPTAVPGTQFDQAIVELVDALSADAVGCTQSRRVVALASSSDSRGQCACRRLVQSAVVFSDFRLGIRQSTASLFDFGLGASESCFDARSLLHQVAERSSDGSRQDEA